MITSLSQLKALSRACILVGVAIAAQTTLFALDDGEVGVAYSDQITIDWGEQGEPEGLTYTVETGSALPDGLSLNSSNGVVSGVPTTVGDYVVIIKLSYGNGASDNVNISITINPQTGTPEITSASDAIGTVGISFTYTITANNSPTAFNLDTDELPPGLSANTTTGVISGTPTEAGTYPMTVSANNEIGTGGDEIITITINPAGDLPVITSSATLNGDAGDQLSYQIVASNTPIEYEASNLPFGVTMDDTSTGFISGTPTIEDTYEVTLRARNEFGWSQTFTLTITIGAVPQISNTLALEIVLDTAMDGFALTASNSPTSFSVSGLPPGLSYSSGTRLITGTPTALGATNVTLYAVNAVGQGPNATLVITVTEGVKPDPAPSWRPASFSIDEVEGETYLFIEFDQTADDLAAFDYTIETSSTLAADSWTSVALDDDSLVVVTTDNGDGTTTVTVRYPDSYDDGLPQYIRYKVTEK